ncbi:hypothetical protein [Mycobacterium saskatchewanense]|uniref:Uncharacterized protein n=1 Tax=Mycobacterium saskatchewanense TaxID=220927 RepID=A0AAJ3NPM4_9MYCO|nr:hypothetical protein [Mycobacterium saskatchewanense]ORW70374.1 hypothetical protein AWC23_17120 [Mycobacterium saskatchewanense]
MVDDDPQIEIINTPPPGYTQEQWDNLSCCVCYGCETCEHSCHLTDDERVERIRLHDEALEAALKGPGRHQLSDGSWVTVRRGQGDPQYLKGDGFDDERLHPRKIQIPIDLPHVDHGGDDQTES